MGWSGEEPTGLCHFLVLLHLDLTQDEGWEMHLAYARVFGKQEERLMLALAVGGCLL